MEQETINQIIQLLAMVIAIASVIAKITPTEVDNKVLALMLKIVDILAINTKPTKLKK